MTLLLTIHRFYNVYNSFYNGFYNGFYSSYKSFYKTLEHVVSSAAGMLKRGKATASRHGGRQRGKAPPSHGSAILPREKASKGAEDMSQCKQFAYQ